MPCTITTIYLCQLDIFVCMFICYSHCYRDCHCAPIIFLTNTTQLYFTCNEAGLRLKVCDILLASIHTLTSMNVCEYVRKMQHPTVHWWLYAHFCRLHWLLKLHVYHFVSTNDVIHCLCLFIIFVLSLLCFFKCFYILLFLFILILFFSFLLWQTNVKRMLLQPNHAISARQAFAAIYFEFFFATLTCQKLQGVYKYVCKYIGAYSISSCFGSCYFL